MRYSLGSSQSGEDPLHPLHCDTVWGVADLVAPLRKLGLAEAFDSDGQFLGLSEAPDVHIEKVFHQVTAAAV